MKEILQVTELSNEQLLELISKTVQEYMETVAATDSIAAIQQKQVELSILCDELKSRGLTL